MQPAVNPKQAIPVQPTDNPKPATLNQSMSCSCVSTQKFMVCKNALPNGLLQLVANYTLKYTCTCMQQLYGGICVKAI